MPLISREAPQNVAVVLNPNARKVSKVVFESVTRYLPKAHVFYSNTFEEARNAIKEIVEKRYELVLCGGGDGTIVNLITQLRNRVLQLNQNLRKSSLSSANIKNYSLPKIGVMPLGTGNGLAGLTNSPRGIKTLEKLAQGGEFKTRELGFVETDGKMAPFAGVGWDAEILNDYIEFKERFKDHPILKYVSKGLIGYLLAVFGIAIPRILPQQDKVTVRITNLGNKVYFINEDRKPVPVQIEPGELLYQGPANVVLASTVPYYGFKLKIFPYVNSVPNTFQLRIAKVRVMDGLLNIIPIWLGTFQHEKIIDYMVESIEAEFSREMPFQVGGDAEGRRKKIRISFGEQKVYIIDFTEDQ